MAAHNEKLEDFDLFSPAARLREGVVTVSDAELTDEHFVRGVALALRAEWEGEDHFAVAEHSRVVGSEPEPTAEWFEYRAESVSAILAFLDVLHHRGYRIVRKAN